MYIVFKVSYEQIYVSSANRCHSINNLGLGERPRNTLGHVNTGQQFLNTTFS